MPRGIPWDELPRSYYHKVIEEEKQIIIKDNNDIIEEKERNYLKEFENIGRRAAFGLVCGSMTGFTFGAVDILRDVKAISDKKSIAINKLARYSGIFGLYFASYHAMRKILKLYYYPISAEENLITSGIICTAPMLFSRTLRPMIPYGMILVVLDAVNGLNDV